MKQVIYERDRQTEAAGDESVIGQMSSCEI